MQSSLDYQLWLYREVAENQGQWLEAEQLIIQIPKQWDLDGNITDHKILSLGIKQYRESQSYDIPSILADHTTDLHYSAKYSFTKKPFYLEMPPFSHKAYEYIFFKRKHQETLLLDIIAFDKRESDLQRKIASLIQELLFESRYSEIGIKKQVEDAIENIFYKSLKKLIRRIGKIHHIEYESMYELTRHVVSSQQINLSLDEIQSIVYKTMISEGLFPFYCEINTMNDPYLKLKLISLFTNSEILPWSPKFHASLALGNYHYSFTPNDLVNLRTLDSRTFHKGYHYIRIRILDFFPLDQWVEKIAHYFDQHFYTILKYVKVKMPKQIQIPTSRRQQEVEPLSNSSISILQDFKDMKEPFLKEEQKETELISELNDSKNRSFSGVVNCAGQFKQLLKTALKKIEFVRQIFGMEIHSPLIVKIKDEISNEFYQNYQSELNRNGILQNFCSIITETEMRSYSTCANNCQTPVAAFIYHLCDTFRPYQETLHEKLIFLKQANNYGFNIINYKSSLSQSKASLLEINSNINSLSNNLSIYCKFASLFEYNLLSNLFIQPAILEYSLDYFGFFSDEIFQHYLKSIRKVDFEPDKFQSQLDKQKKQVLFENSKEQLFQDFEVNEFVDAYENSAKKKLQIPNDKKNLDQFIMSLGANQIEKIQYYKSQFNMHYLIQCFQNKIIQLKQEKKSIKTKHKIQDYLDTAYFFYFNSIRLQLVQKQRKNTLSQIGFVLAKDVACVNKTEPTNIELQMHS